jgi:hypothetical protein
MNPGGFESEPWFKGTMSREDAELYLKTHTTTASFLVRNSSTPGVLCVSVRLKAGSFSHTLISYTAVGWTIEQKESHKAVVAPTLRAMLEQLGYLKPAFLADPAATTASTSNSNLYTAVPPALNIYDATAPAQNEISVSKRGELRRLAAEKGIVASNRPISLPLTSSAPAAVSTATPGPNGNYAPHPASLGSGGGAAVARFAALPVAAPIKPLRNDVGVVPPPASPVTQPLPPYAMPIIASATPIGNAPSLVQVVSPVAAVAKPDSSSSSSVHHCAAACEQQQQRVAGRRRGRHRQRRSVAHRLVRGRRRRGDWPRQLWPRAARRVARHAGGDQAAWRSTPIDLDPKQRADFARECAVLKPSCGRTATWSQFLGVTAHRRPRRHRARLLRRRLARGGAARSGRRRLRVDAGRQAGDRARLRRRPHAPAPRGHRAPRHRRAQRAARLVSVHRQALRLWHEPRHSRPRRRPRSRRRASRRRAGRRPRRSRRASSRLRSDVFMFAVLLFEIFERQKPWASYDPTATPRSRCSPAAACTLSANVPPRDRASSCTRAGRTTPTRGRAWTKRSRSSRRRGPVYTAGGSSKVKGQSQ